MAADVEQTLIDILKNTSFSLQIDESTLPGNEALLLGYVRFIKDENMCEELLFAKTVLTNKTGEAIFHVVETFLPVQQMMSHQWLSVIKDFYLS